MRAQRNGFHNAVGSTHSAEQLRRYNAYSSVRGQAKPPDGMRTYVIQARLEFLFPSNRVHARIASGLKYPSWGFHA